MSIDLGAAVKAEASRLDAAEPGWATRVNRGYLDMSHSCRCVHGQLYGRTYGDYGGYLDHVAGTDPDLARRIDAACRTPIALEGECNRLWRAEIDARTGEASR